MISSVGSTITGKRVPLIAWPLFAVLLWAVVYPNVSVIAGSFAHGLGYWKAFVDSPADREALWTSIWVSIASVVFSTAKW